MSYIYKKIEYVSLIMSQADDDFGIKNIIRLTHYDQSNSENYIFCSCKSNMYILLVSDTNHVAAVFQCTQQINIEV